MEFEQLDELIEETELPSEFDGLPTFIVGGAVRDALRGVSSSDTDLMVAEVSPQEMRSRGFREIDSSNNETFGVFQDSLGREVAIARTEKSTGDSHTDFEIEPIDPDVEASEAVKQDLRRRDFTVNSMVLDLRWGVLHDPYNGVQDLEDGIIEAVDPLAFKQDPLRILRGARFAARLDSVIESETIHAMRESVDGLKELPQERVRLELIKTLKQADQPSMFFTELANVGALEETFPELDALTGIPAGPEEFHGEGDSFSHTMLVIDEMAELRPNDEIAGLMALAHDLGKAVTREEDLPNHPTHTKNGISIVEEMAERLSFSTEQRRAMKEAVRFHMRLHDIDDLRAATVINTFDQANNIDRLIDLTRADSLGRRPSTDVDTDPIESRFDAAEQALSEWTGQRLIDAGYSPDEMGGEEFGNLLHQKRVERMREIEQ